MARPLKAGLDWFPLDTRLDDKMGLIEAEYGLQGFAVVVKLWQRIYQERGYYCDYTPEVALLFLRECGVAPRTKGCRVVEGIVRSALDRGIFHRGLYDKYQILTSAGVQKRYFEACAKRTQIAVNPLYLLVDTKDYFSETVVSDSETIICEGKSTQRREEYSRVENSRVEGEKRTEYDLPSVGQTRAEKIDRPVDEKKVIPLEKDVLDYAVTLGVSAKSVFAFIETMSSSGWMDRDGKPIRDWKAVFRKWTERERSGAASENEKRSLEEEAYRRARIAYERENGGGDNGEGEKGGT